MGLFLNPNNEGFRDVVQSEIYVDKTGLIEYTNRVSNTRQKYICNSRPRRFGKSFTADMLTAYYSKGCDSAKLFCGYKAAETEDFDKYLNQCNVIHLDMQWCMMDAGSPEQTVSYVNRKLLAELRRQYAGLLQDDVTTAFGALAEINTHTGERFVIIIDEWDVLIRDEAAKPAVQTEYINFLRGMFKGSEPSKFIQLAYLTGILPIKKLKTQSALNDFDEFTMLYPGIFAPYIGFTAQEVQELAGTYGRDYEKVREWYDGYLLNGFQIYNPRAVVGVMLTGEFRSYWSSSGTYESILPYINIDFDGLKTSIIEMLSGTEVPVNPGTFQNDVENFKNRDDVLTLLIHMGYLAFRQDRQTAYIPNEEIRLELLNAVRESKWNTYLEFQKESEQLLDAVLDGDEQEVAEKIGRIHDDYASTIQYNNENSLSSVLTLAFLSTLQYYFKPVRELPTGRGFADFIYIPKPEYRADYPAMVVELKWNKKAVTALQQIRDKNYPSSLRQYTGKILLVGISYDKKTKEHTCRIEEDSTEK